MCAQVNVSAFDLALAKDHRECLVILEETLARLMKHGFGSVVRHKESLIAEGKAVEEDFADFDFDSNKPPETGFEPASTGNGILKKKSRSVTPVRDTAEEESLRSIPTLGDDE